MKYKITVSWLQVYKLKQSIFNLYLIEIASILQKHCGHLYHVKACDARTEGQAVNQHRSLSWF